MKDSELQFDRSCHVLYSKPCKKEILAKIALHYPEAEREAVWEQVQLRYAELLSKWRTYLGGKKNFHNGVSGGGICQAVRICGHYARPVQGGLCVHGTAPCQAGADDHLRGRLPMRLYHLRR